MRNNRANFSRMELGDMIHKYNNDISCEFEVRTVINYDLYKILIDHFSKEPYAISQTLNVISQSDKSSFIQTRTFVKGKQQLEKTHSSKTRIASLDVKSVRNYKIALSSEKEINPAMFKITNDSIYRFKWRHSIILDDWSIDITFSRETKNAEETPKIRAEMFRETNEPPENYDRIELELECKTRPLHDLDFVKSIFEITDRDNFMQLNHENIVREMAAVMGRDNRASTIKELTARVIDLTKNKLSELRPELSEYYITDKADGERTIIFVAADKVHIINSKLQTIDLGEKGAPDLVKTIIDTELVDEKEFWAFDILNYSSHSTREKNLTERLVILQEAADKINTLCLQLENGQKLKINVKRMFLLGDQIEKQTKAAVEYVKSRKYETDGYILTKNGEYYLPAFKLKYLSHVSIDFWVIKAQQNLIGSAQYMQPKKGDVLYFLYVGIQRVLFERHNMEFLNNEPIKREKYNEGYIPVHFCPSSDPYAYVFWHKDDSLDNKVCELTRRSESWHLMRVREDRDVNLATGRYFGNDFRIAENIWQSYTNPIHIEDLYQSSGDEYFKVHDNSIYKTVRAFNNFAKGCIIKDAANFVKTRFPDSELVCVDFGGGKGQDLFKYKSKFAHTIFVDADKTALQELVSRKNEIEGKPKFDRANKGAKIVPAKMRVSVIHADLNQDYKITSNAIKRFTNRAHIVICNMAMHYLVENESAIKNFTQLVSSILIQGGIFMYTDLNGQKVYNLIADQDWEYREGTVLKYSIRKMYKPKEPFGISQRIKIVLPFSNGEHYEECLVNNERVHSEFESLGFNGAQEFEFDEFHSRFESESSRNSDGVLSATDKQFVNLYSGAIIRKGLPESVTINKSDPGVGRFSRHVSQIKKTLRENGDK